MAFGLPRSVDRGYLILGAAVGLILLAAAVQLVFDFDKGHTGGGTSSAGTPDPEQEPDSQDKSKQEDEKTPRRARQGPDFWKYKYN